MDLRSDRPGDKKPAPKLVVFDTKTSNLTSYVGKEVASKVHLDLTEGIADDHLPTLWKDIQGFRTSAVAGADALEKKEQEVFKFRFGYAQAEMESWIQSLKQTGAA